MIAAVYVAGVVACALLRAWYRHQAYRNQNRHRFPYGDFP